MNQPSPSYELQAYLKAIGELTYGKKLPSAVYVVDDLEFPIPEFLRLLANRLRERFYLGQEFNLLDRFSKVFS